MCEGLKPHQRFGLLAAPYLPSARNQSDVCFLDTQMHLAKVDFLGVGLRKSSGCLRHSHPDVNGAYGGPRAICRAQKPKIASS